MLKTQLMWQRNVNLRNAGVSKRYRIVLFYRYWMYYARCAWVTMLLSDPTKTWSVKIFCHEEICFCKPKLWTMSTGKQFITSRMKRTLADEKNKEYVSVKPSRTADRQMYTCTHPALKSAGPINSAYLVEPTENTHDHCSQTFCKWGWPPAINGQFF